MSHRVFVKVNAVPEHADTLRARVSGNVARARGEDGCILFEAAEPTDGSDTLLIWEHWSSKSAFDTHNAQPYMREFYAEMGEWISGHPEIIEIQALDE